MESLSAAPVKTGPIAELEAPGKDRKSLPDAEGLAEGRGMTGLEV